MRWDGMRIEPDGTPRGGPGAAPALFERGAVARTFDTPGFRGMTFFEVHARSVINRVPDASRVPFRWTINPYRGCSHACRYCLAGETPILMADGRTRPLADLRPGDQVYGTQGQGAGRRYVRTGVLAHWQTVKPAYRITLQDGTQLVASGDHRFLSDRGWQHVAAARGPLQRPHLTVHSALVGMGHFAEPPKHDADYRRGYLCGMIRGGGPDGRAGARRHAHEALARAHRFLADAHRAFASRLIEWPQAPRLEWHKGYLAGLFDAGGSCRRGTVRLSGTDPAIAGWLASSLRELGFAFATERPPAGRGGPLPRFRLTGGGPETLRFFLTTDPASTGLLSIAGTPARSTARLRVTTIEPLGLDLPMYDITTGTGDFIANGVVSHNCFARNTHTYLDLDAGHDFDSKIVVKVNAPELVRKELAAPKWAGEHIAMGTNVDVYQRAEGRYRLMPGILQALLDSRNPYSILTKGTLILRDLDLLAASAEVTDVGLSVSVGCTDEDLWRTLEPGTPSPLRRLGVCATLSGHGLRCGVLMGPVVPFLSDSPAQLEATVRQVAGAGATHVSPIVLHLRPGARDWFLAWLARHHPALVPRYRGLYGSRAYAPRDYQERIAGQVRELAERYRVGRGSPPPIRRWRGPAAAPPPAPAAEQLTLL
ncbi:MAG TPA: intein-containing Rv2578c family radical SAM protein [Streptosporangiaceae bacterium]|nr:intein-containing Rv2578c family radical SAM protein [Streptosporangiaceae bacterium]